MPNEIRVGELLAAKYRLEELLGSGGMGHVYRAVNVEIERPVAIKVLRGEHAANGAIVERFLREARAANLVRHPNVVDVVDVGRDGNGSPFIVQELLEGEDLSRYVERRGGRLSLAEVREYLLPVIDALAQAHANGVVHRDIKPDNVFLASQGQRCVPKLLDFGISKVRASNIKATEVGVMLGTPAYMAPEQVRGFRNADPRSDVWALGIMLFELLSGVLPFDGDDAPAVFVEIATKDAPRLIDVIPDVSEHVSFVVERCLRRRPEERYPTASELARDLQHVLDHVLSGEAVEETKLRAASKSAQTSGRVDFDVPDLALGTARDGARGVEGESPRRAHDSSRRPGSSAASSRYGEGPSSSRYAEGPTSRGLSDAPSLDVPALAPPSSGRHRAAAPDSTSSSRRSPVTPSAAAPSSSGRQRAASSNAGSQLELDVPTSARGFHSDSGMTGSSPTSYRGGAQGALPGVMFGGSSAASHRRVAPGTFRPEPNASSTETEGMSLVVGIAVVGLTSIGATAAMMSLLPHPDGWSLVSLVTKPTSTLNLVVQGGLAVLGFVIAAKLAVSAVQSWRAHGGRGAAIFHALITGGFFYAALQLARAAW